MTNPHFEYLRKFLKDKAAIIVSLDKDYLFETRLGPLAIKEGFKSLDEMISSLQSKPLNGLHQKVIDAMTTNETLFFRDIHPFDTLKKIIIPDLIKKRAAEKTLYLWCMASSSGQEPYSMAIMLADTFPILKDWKIFFLASDISDEMIERTKKGIYSQVEVNRGLPATYLIKYFEKAGSDWQLKEPIRNMVKLQNINLISTWPTLPKMDIIFLRNVLIYFDVETKKSILAKVRQNLKQDGYFFLGGSESTLGLDDNFERVALDKTTYYRLKGNL